MHTVRAFSKSKAPEVGVLHTVRALCNSYITRCSLDVNHFGLAVYEQQPAYAAERLGALAQLALDGRVGNLLHAARVEDDPLRLVQSLTHVLVDRTCLVRPRRLHLPHLAEHQDVGGLGALLLAATDELYGVADGRQSLGRLQLVGPDVRPRLDDDLSFPCSHGGNYNRTSAA